MGSTQHEAQLYDRHTEQQGGALVQMEPPAQRLQRLEAESAQLATQQQQVRQELAGRSHAAAATAAASREADGWGDHAMPGPPLPSDLPALAAELAVLTAGCTSLQSLQELQGLNRHAEAMLRKVEEAGMEPNAYFPAVEQAVLAYEVAAQQATVLSDASAAAAAAWSLSGHMEEALGRTTAVRDNLYGSLLAALQMRLAEVGWPPPIATTSGTQENGGAAAVPADAKSAARVFERASKQLLLSLRQLLAAMFALQKADDPAGFAKAADSGGEGPMLWGVAELSAPIAARLRRHFAGGGMPTDRVDRPEWLFATAARLAADLGPAVAPLQPALAAAQLSHAYAFQFEFARTIRDNVKSLLREHLLPRLLAEGGSDPGLWTHFATAAAAFERQLAPLRGVTVESSMGDEEDGILPSIVSADGCLTVIFEDGEWQESWLAAERTEAEEAAVEALEAPDAWRPLDTSWDSMDLDQLPAVASNGPTSTEEAWTREFWPSTAADAVLTLVTDSVKRAAWLPSPHQRRAYLAAVPQEVLRGVHKRLVRSAQAAAEFKDLSGPEYAPAVAARVSAAHFLEHNLREGPALLLLLDLQVSETAMSSEDMAASSGRRRGGRFEREVSLFGAFRREWGLKLAKALAAAFSRAAHGYTLNLDAFATMDDGEEGDVSPRLAGAVTAAAEGLQLLSRHLDAVVFRDVWRAVAVALNRMLYNDIATEARFSMQGAAQFGRDVGAVAALLGRFTPRPAAHFRELLDASRLLALPSEEAGEIARVLEEDPEAGLLGVRAAGATRLTAQQARRVLSQRLY